MNATGHISLGPSSWEFNADFSTQSSGQGYVIRDLTHDHYRLANDVRVAGLWLGMGNPEKYKPNFVRIGSGSLPALSDQPVRTDPPEADEVIKPYIPILELSAVYAKDDVLGEGTGTLAVKQKYVFTNYNNDPSHEPSGRLKAARFYPLLEFTYSPGRNLERQLAYIRADYRLQFNLDDLPERAVRRNVGPLNQAGIFSDRDVLSITQIAGLKTTVGRFKQAAGAAELLQIFRSIEKPLKYEVIGQGVKRGWPDCWDNIHLWGLEPDKFVQWVFPSTPGCFHCAHTHWRWSTVAADPPWLARLSGVIKGGEQFSSGRSFSTVLGATVGPSPGVPKLDYRVADQTIHFAIISRATDSRIDYDKNAERAMDFDSLFTSRDPQMIENGSQVVLWISIEVFRQPSLSQSYTYYGRPISADTGAWAGTLFVHGLFFAHEPEPDPKSPLRTSLQFPKPRLSWLIPCSQF